MFFLVLSCIRILKNIKKILLIIQRSNGDVFLSHPLVSLLNSTFSDIKIDLLVNEDTVEVAKLIPNVNLIHTFSYQKKQNNRIKQEKNLILSIFRKYDLSINLTASDRSVMYAILAGKQSLSAVEKNPKKSWWKKKLLTYHYCFDSTNHILLNNLEPLNILNILFNKILPSVDLPESDSVKMVEKLSNLGIRKFLIFHPSAQYNYKIYPKHLRDKLFDLLSSLDVAIIVTGGSSIEDLKIKEEIPNLSNIYNFIGDTSLKDYLFLSQLSIAYIGMDTLNMHIAASQNKRIFAIFGPTNLKMWSPWSNQVQSSATQNMPIQNYGNVTIFQADMPCVACAKAGCNDNHGKSDCLYKISPEFIFREIENWFLNSDEGL
jgi:heptosyltransferase III